jgi:hypothetical protein
VRFVKTRTGYAEAAPPRHRMADPPVPVHPVVALGRAVVAVAAVTNPVPAVIVLGLVVVARAVPQVWRRRIAAAGTAAVLAGALVGALRWYTAPYRELAASCLHVRTSWAPCAAQQAAERWPGWLLAQTPYAVALAACVGGWWLVRRTRYEPAWRAVPQRAKPPVLAEAMTALFTDPPVPARLTRADDLVVRLGAEVFTAAPVTVPARACRQHLLVAGITGSGKSRTIELLAHEFVARRDARPLKIAFVFADLKADPGLVQALRGAARRAGRRFQLVTITTAGGTTYNPIRHGTAEQVRSRIIETLDSVADGGFSEPHHREAAEEFLLYAVRVLDELIAAQVREEFADGTTRVWRRDLVDLAVLLSLTQLQHRKAHLSRDLQREIGVYFLYLAAEGRDLKRSLPGLATRVRNLVSGQGRWILADREDGLDLYDAIQGGDVVLFSLAAESDAKAARQLGTLFLTDLGATGQRLQAAGFAASGRMFVAGVDEFSGLGGRTMGALFQRLRAGGGSLALCTQDLADLRAVSAEFHDTVVTNTNVKILHRQAMSAAVLADLLGTDERWRETLSYTDRRGLDGGTTTAGSGSGQLVLEDRPRVHPNEFKDLGVGEAVVVVGQPDNALYRARIHLAPRFPDPGIPSVTRAGELPPKPGAAPRAVPGCEAEPLPAPPPGPGRPDPPEDARAGRAVPDRGAGDWDDWDDWDEIPTSEGEPAS